MSIHFSRLTIEQRVLAVLQQLPTQPGQNRAFFRLWDPDTIFMEYQENGEKYFTVLDKHDYALVSNIVWEGFNNYIVSQNDHTKFLHRVICRNLMPEQIVHHLGDRFDNRGKMLVPVSQQEHDRHRTYYGDLHIS